MNPMPSVRYARSGTADLAYIAIGAGPGYIEVPHTQMSHLRCEWQIDSVREWWERLARTHTVVRFDNRGGGLSRGEEPDFRIDTLAADIGVVADAAGLERFALYGRITGALPAIAYAARNPERVSHLVLWNGFARNVDHGENPRMRSLFALASSDWELFTESISQAALGWQGGALARQWAAVLREATTPERLQGVFSARRGWDVFDLLHAVEAPTLVLYDALNALASEERCRELASEIPGARLLAIESATGTPAGEAGDAIEALLGARRSTRAALPGDLTEREAEVLGLLATGASNAEIALQLDISINTVTRHLTHVYAKVGAANRGQAIRYAIERGLLG